MQFKLPIPRKNRKKQELLFYNIFLPCLLTKLYERYRKYIHSSIHINNFLKNVLKKNSVSKQVLDPIMSANERKIHISEEM
jgi:hypothetical protein